MDATNNGYEFLDLTDIDDEERSSLTSALFAQAPQQQPPPPPQPAAPPQQTAWTDPNYDISSCSSGTPGPPTASSSLDSLAAGEREMAPHSPHRGRVAAAPAAQPPPPPPPSHLTYSQPPPALYNPNPANQWGLPPNVYVSQVTANVNVHGYMGQYYHSQYVPQSSQEVSRGGRDRNKGRRGGGVKRGQSPPSYVYPYYPSPQTAQGAPLYHQVPLYYPMSYVTAGYPYVPYVDYGMMEDPNNPGEKVPDDYPQDMMLEQDGMSHDMYYPPPHACLPPPPGPMYDPNRPMEGPCPVEQYPQFFQMPQPPPLVHQFNVHAKNFVRQGEHKHYNPQQDIKMQESQSKINPLATTVCVEGLPIKDMKISSANKPVIKQVNEKIANVNTPTGAKPPANDKLPQKPIVDPPKSTWIPSTKAVDQVAKAPPPPVSAQPVVTTVVPSATVNKTVVSATSVQTKLTKTTTPPPFVNKPFVKSGQTTQMGAVILPQQGLPSKAPFSNKHKKESLIKNATDSTEQPEAAPSVPSSSSSLLPVSAANENVKLNFVPKSVSAPISIPVNNNNNATITSKAPFGSTRKSSVSSPADSHVHPTTGPPPQAPTPSDFPLPPGPRRPHQITPQPPDQPSNNVVSNAPQQPAAPSGGGKTWASLFISPPPAQGDTIASNTQTVSTCTVTTVTGTNVRPIAKVCPFDSSPLSSENLTSNCEKSNISKNMESKDNSVDGKMQIPSHIIDPHAYKVGEFLHKYQLDHHSVSLQPRGLCNRSNYCYINAILQALIACPPFYNMLRNLPHQLKKEKSRTPIIDAMVELVSEFTPLPPGARVTRPERVTRSSPGTATTGDNADSVSTIVSPPVNCGPAFEPLTVLHMLRDINHGDSFHVEGRQEDAEEFLGCLLNGLNDEMLELIKLIDPEDAKDVPIVNGNEIVPEFDDDENWKVMGPKNKGSIERRCLAGRTPLSDIFRGQLRSRLQRATDTAASDATHCVQPFFTLPLDIERSNSVREALERVAGKDKLEGVTCPSKGRPVEAWQQVLLEQLPAVLLLHLKCFHSRVSDGATVKIVKTIDYPVDLKIDPKIISTKIKYTLKQRSYKLFAVVYHEGSEAEKGHYLTDVFHVGCSGWLRYDDSIVTSVTEHQVLHPRSPRTPYLLFYRRQDTLQQLVRHQQSS